MRLPWWLGGRREEHRSIDSVPWNVGDGGPLNLAGVSPEAALRLAPVYAASDRLAGAISSLPLQVYRQTGRRREKLATLPELFRQPAVVGTRVDWVYRTVISAALRGNAVGMISAVDDDGYAQRVEWLRPDLVSVRDDAPSGPGSPWQPLWFYRGREVPTEAIVHIPWFCQPGRVWGLSPVGAYAATAGIALAAHDYKSDWFRAGGVPPGRFRNTTKTVTPADAQVVKQRLVLAIRSHEPLVYGSDWEYEPLAVAGSDAQFVETMRLTATQVAAIYGIPPEMIGGETGNSLCVDTATEILTTRGWLRYDQVAVGDTCLTLNADTGLAEWQPVQGVYVCDGPHDVMVLRSGTHSSVTTLDHRWPVFSESRRDGRLQVDDHMSWRRTESMTSSDRILAAAPVANLPSVAKWSDALVELVAWFYTEGYVDAWGSVRIAQSHRVNPQNCARIRAALIDLLGPVVDEKHVRSRPAWVEDVHPAGVTHFRLNKLASAALLAAAPEKVPQVGWLAELTRAQLELFVQVSIDADGSVTNFGTPVLGQKDLRRLEAFQVACALTGRSGVIRRNAAGMWSMAVQTTSRRIPKGRGDYVSRERVDGPVWCPTTPNRTWFARRDGTTYFTGNTYTNVEQHAINFVQFTLLPWLSRLEAAFSALLPPGQYVKFNVDALIRPDISTRYQSYRVAREIGLMSIDEIRALEDLAPLPGGRGQDYTPLAVLAKGASEPVAGRGRHRLELLPGGDGGGIPDIDDGPGGDGGHGDGASVSALNNGTTG